PPKRACRLHIRIGGICSSQFHSSRGGGNPFCTRGGGGNRHPRRDPTPAGATDAGVGVRTESSRAVEACPLSGNCRDGHDARPVEGRPTGGGGGCRPAGPQLASNDVRRNGNEARTFTLFHPHKDAALTFRARALNDFPHVSRRRHGLSTNLEDYIASRKPVIGGNTSRIDTGNNDTLRSRAGDARSRGERKPEF